MGLKPRGTLQSHLTNFCIMFLITCIKNVNIKCILASAGTNKNHAAPDIQMWNNWQWLHAIPYQLLLASCSWQRFLICPVLLRGRVPQKSGTLVESVISEPRPSSPFFFQRSVLHQDLQRGLPVPGEPGSRPHPEPHRLLPDEHTCDATLHLPLPAWGERAEPSGAYRGWLRTVFPGHSGGQQARWSVLDCRLLPELPVCCSPLWPRANGLSHLINSLPPPWADSSRVSQSGTSRCGQATWRGLFRQRRHWACLMSSGRPSTRSTLWAGLFCMWHLGLHLMNASPYKSWQKSWMLWVLVKYM